MKIKKVDEKQRVCDEGKHGSNADTVCEHGPNNTETAAIQRVKEPSS